MSAELRARSNLSSILWADDPRRAVDMQRTNLDLARRVGNRQMANWIVVSAAVDAWLTGRDWDAALAELGDALGASGGPAEEKRMLA